jgi:hypothetical protein
MKLEFIRSPNEIPAGVRYVLVMMGEGNIETRHSRGITIQTEKARGDGIDGMRSMLFDNAVVNAQRIARQEGIEIVFVVPWFGQGSSP